MEDSLPTLNEDVRAVRLIPSLIVTKANEIVEDSCCSQVPYQQVVRVGVTFLSLSQLESRGFGLD